MERPYCKEMLKQLSKHYEIVVFTAGMKDYADYILDELDSERKLISHRLYRHHTKTQSDCSL